MRRVLPSAVACACLLTAMVTTAATSATHTPERTHRYIVVLEKSSADVAETLTRQRSQYSLRDAVTYDYAFRGYSARLTAAAAAKLQADPTVAFVTADRRFELADVNEPQRRPLWRWNRRIDGHRSSTKAGNGRGAIDVNVAVLDTGIDGTHPDLNAKAGVDCSSGSPQPFPQGQPSDESGHGTFVAGNVGARDNAIGVVGAAPGTPVWAVKVATVQGPLLSALVCGVNWVTSTRYDADPRNDIVIANMSLEGPLPDDQHCGWKVHDPLHVAICRSVAAGVTYTVSAGNGGQPFTGVAPANYDQVLTVTAMADFDGKPGGLAESDCYGQDYSDFMDDTVAPFSNYAVKWLDKRHTIAAPGVCVTSTVPGGYAPSAGTSFASPIVAGTAAMCVSSGACAGLSPRPLINKVVRIMKNYNQEHRRYGFRGDPIRPMEDRYYGYLVNQSMF